MLRYILCGVILTILVMDEGRCGLQEDKAREEGIEDYDDDDDYVDEENKFPEDEDYDYEDDDKNGLEDDDEHSEHGEL